MQHHGIPALQLGITLPLQLSEDGLLLSYKPLQSGCDIALLLKLATQLSTLHDAVHANSSYGSRCFATAHLQSRLIILLICLQLIELCLKGAQLHIKLPTG